MKTFYASCIAVFLVLVVITMALRSESTTFYGIADAQEIAVNDEFAVEIRKIHVVPGQRVSVGDTLVEVKTPELDLKIAEINRDLGELKKQKSMHARMTQSEVRQLKSEQAVLVNQLRGEIRELEVQLEANRKLVSELRSIKKGSAEAESGNEFDNPIAVRLQQLRKALELALDSANIGEQRLSNELSYAGEPLAERINGLQKELDLLMEAKQQSSKTSPITGIVGVICFKEGEKVSPFTPICSLHTESPSFVRGYIHENVYSQVKMGQKVLVSSSANKHTEVAGEVIGVGARIVEYPVRLRKSPEMLMWGREVTIKIPDANRFLLGERVKISLSEVPRENPDRQSRGSPFGSSVYAQTLDAKAGDTVMETPRAITGLSPSVRIEASGVSYCRDLDKFLLISDDTERKKPVLFLMNRSGRIEKEIAVQGAPDMNDMEGITQDGNGSVYILCSQSANRNGKLPASRRSFVRAARKGESLSFAGTVDLTLLLEKSAVSKSSKPWAAALGNALRNGMLDIEGLTVHNGTLYLGLKAPRNADAAMILTLGKADRVFADDGPDATSVDLWNEWRLADPVTGEAGGISGLHHDGKSLFILSVAAAEGTKECGNLWQYRDGDLSPRHLRRFAGLKPEGIAYNTLNGTLLIVFDNGSKQPSQILLARTE